jgi:hypothetical protein
MAFFASYLICGGGVPLLYCADGRKVHGVASEAKDEMSRDEMGGKPLDVS